MTEMSSKAQHNFAIKTVQVKLLQISGGIQTRRLPKRLAPPPRDYEL